MSHVHTDLPFPEPAPPAGFLIAALGSSILHALPRNLTLILPPAHFKTTASLRYNWHVVICTRSKCAVRWVFTRVYTCDTMSTVEAVNIPSPANARVTTGELPFSSHPRLPALSSQAVRRACWARPSETCPASEPGAVRCCRAFQLDSQILSLLPSSVLSTRQPKCSLWNIPPRCQHSSPQHCPGSRSPPPGSKPKAQSLRPLRPCVAPTPCLTPLTSRPLHRRLVLTHPDLATLGSLLSLKTLKHLLGRLPVESVTSVSPSLSPCSPFP